MALPSENVRDLIRATERADPEEQWALLCFVAGRNVTIDAHDLNAALRRSELLLATGGDPRRPLELYGRAVTALAEDLDEPHHGRIWPPGSRPSARRSRGCGAPARRCDC